MKRIFCLFLIAALALTALAAVVEDTGSPADTSSGNTGIAEENAEAPVPESAGTDIEAPETASGQKPLVPMQLSSRAPVYQAENGRIAGYAYEGFVIVPTEYKNDRYYFQQGVVGGTQTYYIHARYLVQSDFAGEASPLSISGDVLTLKKGAALYAQTGETLYTVRIPSAPFYYVLKDDRGYNFVFGARYVYVLEDQAAAGSPGEVSQSANALEGVIAEVYGSDSFLMSVTNNNKLDNVVINYSDATLPKAKLNAGDGVRVIHDGFMTAQETPVIKALQLSLVEAADLKRSSGSIRGTVDVFDGNMMTVSVENSARFDRVNVDCSAADAKDIKAGMSVEIEAESVVSDSEIPLVRAKTVTPLNQNRFTLTGSVTQLSSDENTLLMSTAENGEVQVHFTGAKMPKMALAPGLNVTVVYDGKMTRSIPPQITALEVMPE